MGADYTPTTRRPASPGSRLSRAGRVRVGVVHETSPPACPLPDQDSRSRAELETLTREINQLNESLARDRTDAGLLDSGLREIEQERADIARRTGELEAGLRELHQRQRQSSIELEARDAELARARTRFRAFARSGYILARSDGLKMALASEDPGDAAYRLQLFTYLVQAQRSEMLRLREAAEAYEHAAREDAAREAEVAAELVRVEASRETLAGIEQQRRLELARLQDSLADGEQRMRAMRLREKELRRLIETLARSPRRSTSTQPPGSAADGDAVKPAPSSTPSSAPSSAQSTTRTTTTSPGPAAQPPARADLVPGGFSLNRGRMRLPTAGRIRYRYGQRRPESGLTWEGIMVQVAAGESVTAIYPGQVVFADWFGGYGQLLVLDHGDGFMSLYGHNQSLDVALGDAVAAGQVVARAGDTGGLNQPGLYFEIRYNGEPDDPLKWVRL